MNLFADALAWLFSPDRLTGSLPLPLAVTQHLLYTFVSVLIAAAIAIPLGWFIGHTGRGRQFAIGLSGAARAVPAARVGGQEVVAVNVDRDLVGEHDVVATGEASLPARRRRTRSRR